MEIRFQSIDLKSSKYQNIAKLVRVFQISLKIYIWNLIKFRESIYLHTVIGKFSYFYMWTKCVLSIKLCCCDRLLVLCSIIKKWTLLGTIRVTQIAKLIVRRRIDIHPMLTPLVGYQSHIDRSSFAIRALHCITQTCSSMVLIWHSISRHLRGGAHHDPPSMSLSSR